MMRCLLLMFGLSWFIPGVLASCLSPFKDQGFIDHHNLRKLQPSRKSLSNQVTEIKANLDKASDYGITHYVLFSRSFESLVCYDFEVPGIGNVGSKAFSPYCEHRRNAALYSSYLRLALKYADAKGIRVFFHTNQFEFPNEIYTAFGDLMKGTAPVCPGKEFVWELFRGKIREFFQKFPECDGLQITADETQVSALRCQCSDCKNMTVGQRIDRMINEAAKVCDELSKELQVRTWGRVGELEQERDPSRMLDNLPEGVVVSVKNTKGDFYLTEPISNMLGFGDDRQVVEFDCWGEYMGWNNFPCYLGDVLSERMKLIAAKNVRRVAARLSWDPFTNYIFDQPWGNEVNVYVYSRLAQDPGLNPDDLLDEWIATKFPPERRSSAFQLYKRSAELQKVWMTFQGWNANDHSRVFYNPNSTYQRVIDKVDPDKRTYSEADLNKRRKDIDAALREAEKLIEDLGPTLTPGFRNNLLHGAKTEWFVAHGVTNELDLLRISMTNKESNLPPDLATILRRIRKFDEEWQRYDPIGYKTYFGMAPLQMLDEIMKMREGA